LRIRKEKSDMKSKHLVRPQLCYLKRMIGILVRRK
jgi:hypothetical protein